MSDTTTFTDIHEWHAACRAAGLRGPYVIVGNEPGWYYVPAGARSSDEHTARWHDLTTNGTLTV